MPFLPTNQQRQSTEGNNLDNQRGFDLSFFFFFFLA